MKFVYVVSDIGETLSVLLGVLGVFTDLEQAKQYCLEQRAVNIHLHKQPYDINIIKICLNNPRKRRTIPFLTE